MPYSRETYTQLKSDAAQDIAANLPGSNPLLRFSNLGVLGKMIARFANLHYGFQDWISRMAVPFTALNEYLLGWGALKGVFLKQPTTAGAAVAGVWTSSGLSTVGTPVPAGTPLVRGDQFEYITTALATVGGGGTVSCPIMATATGLTGNAPVNTPLTLGVSIPGMQTGGLVTTAVQGGADLETMDAYRSRMLQVYQTPPQGGARADYIKWALEVAGVTRAWCKPLGLGAGTVVVWFMEDVVESAFNGFPQGTNGVAAAETRDFPATGDQLIVANYIYGSTVIARQPVGALVYLCAPLPNPQAFTIAHIPGVSAGIKMQIAAAIAGVFIEQGDPTAINPFIDMGDIEAAIDAIPGTAGFIIQVPNDNIQNVLGNLPTVGIITYVA